MIQVDLSGNFSTGSIAGDHALLFARTWADRLADDLPAAVAASEHLVRDSRNFERMEDHLSEEDLERSFRRMWSANAAAVWTAYQAHRWLVRLARELREEEPADIDVLRVLRNALEHLDSALFDEDGLATEDPGDKRAWSLTKLGGLRVQSWAPNGPLFALVDVDSIRALSREITDQLEVLMDAVVEDYLVQTEIDRRRGK